MSDLDRTDFNDRAESIIVPEGVWEVCSDARLNGRCARLQPGECRNLQGSLDRSISSVREVLQAPPAPVYAPSALGGQPRHLLQRRQLRRRLPDFRSG
jgi:Beta/Gamma crystallin